MIRRRASWAAWARGRSADGEPPLPDLYAQMRAFAASHATDKYGDDMVFLETYLRPLCASLCHHSAAAKGGRLVEDVVPRPFPTTSYRGFVGQPVNCPGRCGWELFVREGCSTPRPRPSSRSRSPRASGTSSHAVAGVAAFLGGF